MKRFVAIALAIMFLLSTGTSTLCAQESSPTPPTQPPSSADIAQMKLDLALLIAQRNYWKDRSDSFEQTVTQLSSKLAILEQSLQTSQDPQALLVEIKSLRQQLKEAQDSLTASQGILASKAKAEADQQALLDKTDKDHKAEFRSWQYGAWLGIGAGLWSGLGRRRRQGGPGGCWHRGRRGGGGGTGRQVADLGVLKKERGAILHDDSPKWPAYSLASQPCLRLPPSALRP